MLKGIMSERKDKAENLLLALGSTLKKEEVLVDPDPSFAAGIMRSIRTENGQTEARQKKGASLEQELWGVLWRYSIGALSCAALALIFAAKSDIANGDSDVDLLFDQITEFSEW